MKYAILLAAAAITLWLAFRPEPAPKPLAPPPTGAQLAQAERDKQAEREVKEHFRIDELRRTCRRLRATSMADLSLNDLKTLDPCSREGIR
jgi:hypothetical protein